MLHEVINLDIIYSPLWFSTTVHQALFNILSKYSCLLIRYDISCIVYQVMKLDSVITTADCNSYKGEKNETK